MNRVHRSRAMLIGLALIAFFISGARAESVKVAAVHFGPVFADVTGNRARLVQLTTQAAENGAKIAVLTEMATSGYAFFSRAELAKVAEPLDGPTIKALGDVARKYQIYVVVGLPTVNPEKNSYFNSAVLIGPAGTVAGTYNKRSMLLESAYNAIDESPVPVFDTPYGKVAIVICADLFYSEIPRIAAVAGADILFAPANVGIDPGFVKVRAYENNTSIIVANRYGKEGQGTRTPIFSQDTFAIDSPFPYDFSWGSKSLIVTKDEQLLADAEAPQDTIAYGELPVKTEHVLPVVRRPELYGLLDQDTLEPYTFTQLGLPKPGIFAAAAIDPGPSGRTAAGVAAALKGALDAAKAKGWKLRLAVLPDGMFDQMDDAIVAAATQLVDAEGVDVVLPFARENANAKTPVSLFIASAASGTHAISRYYRTHRMRNEGITVGDNFLVIDRDYGRVGVLQGPDLIAPEASLVMEKMGVDVLAVSVNSSDPVQHDLWQSRTGDYVHIVLANAEGPEGIYFGGYQDNPSQVEQEGLALAQIDTSHVRNKKETRHLDVTSLLLRCNLGRC